MNDLLCNSGYNFFILDPNGDYYRCYSHRDIRFNDNKKNISSLGNMVKDNKMRQIPENEFKCPFEMNCQYGCRTSCDYAETIRYNHNGTISNEYNEQKKLYRLEISDDVKLLKNDVDIYWALTERCNYQCVFCNYPGAEYAKEKDKELSSKEIIEIFEKIVNQFNFVMIHLTGGEPALHESFLELCERICFYQDKVNLRLISNLSFYNKHKEVFSWNWKRRESFQVFSSCHFSENSFDLDKFVELGKMVKNKHQFVISTVDHPYEKNFYQEYYEYFRKQGFTDFAHQYYEPSRARDPKVDNNFIPKTLSRIKKDKSRKFIELS